jgi:hypothetical protein
MPWSAQWSCTLLTSCVVVSVGPTQRPGRVGGYGLAQDRSGYYSRSNNIENAEQLMQFDRLPTAVLTCCHVNEASSRNQEHIAPLGAEHEPVSGEISLVRFP